jgi:hypothetical protein
MAEEAMGAWKSDRYGPELTKDLVPLLDGGALLSWMDFVKDGLQSFSVVVWKLQGIGNYGFPCFPVSISLEKLLDRYRLLVEGGVVRVKRVKSLVHGVK